MDVPTENHCRNLVDTYNEVLRGLNLMRLQIIKQLRDLGYQATRENYNDMLQQAYDDGKLTWDEITEMNAHYQPQAQLCHNLIMAICFNVDDGRWPNGVALPAQVTPELMGLYRQVYRKHRFNEGNEA